VSFSYLGANLIILVDVFVDRALTSALAAPVVALSLMIALLALFAYRPHALTRALYLFGGSAAAVWFEIAVATADPSIAESATYLLNRPAVALILLVPLVLRPLNGIIWCTVGFALAIAVISIASGITGQALPLGWGPFTIWMIYLVIWVALTVIRARRANHGADLARLEEETRRMDLESQFEQRAAAIIHDTVLGDLTVVMNSPGLLDERARDRFRADVATLADPSWLNEPEEPLAVDSRDVALRNGMVALTSEMQWRGLTVDVTGDTNQVVALSSKAVAAVLGAVRACLENVLLHSGTRSAELVLGPTEAEATVMIIDHGVGFDVDLVPDDRLGLRKSVVQRVEAVGGAVRIWSRPDSGTSIMISIPNDFVSEVDDA
jgi:signal transduction histidine kinase